MKSIVLLTQILALAGVSVAEIAIQTKAQANKLKHSATKVQGTNVPIPEAEILNRINKPRAELKSTPQQLAAATKRNEALLRASQEKSKKKSPHTTTIIHNEFKPLTEAEQNALKRGRAAAIEESMVRQVRPEESVIDHSEVNGKDYVFSYSDTTYFSGGASAYLYSCPGDRVVVSSADWWNSYGNHEYTYSWFHDNNYNYYTPTINFINGIPTVYGSGMYLEFVNDMPNCGTLFYQTSCVDSNYYGYACGGEITTKRFYEFTGGYEPYIYKPEFNEWSDMCYDQSQYFCANSGCLNPATSPPSTIDQWNNTYTPWSWAAYCSGQFGGFGSLCPKNATCSHGKYECDPGFKDAFSLDHYISDPSDCTACQMSRGCILDDTVFPPSEVISTAIPYNISYSFSNTLDYMNVSLGNICGKNITVYGCTDDQFGDQYMELTNANGNRASSNDDIYSWRICSRVKPQWSIDWICEDAYLKLGCFGASSCGGSVEVTVGPGCDAGTYSPSGFKPCVACPNGLSNAGSGNTGCNRCASGYIGINGTAPCVPCPDGYIEHNHKSCEACSASTLRSMSGDLYDKCLAQLLNKIPVLEQRVDGMVAAFEQYLEDTKYGMPTVHPTAMPTRRRRSRAPTAGSM